jgi:6-phosphogluconolactonase
MSAPPDLPPDLPPGDVAWREEPDRAALAQALATRVADALARRLKIAARAALAVSGGTTPTLFFERLAARSLDWSRVDVTLVDERWVPDSSPRSNAALARAHLLQGAAAAATFLPLTSDDPTPQAGLARLEARLAALATPFAAVVLGMGLDGHTASFFPGADRLVAALDRDAPGRLEAIHAAGAPEPRVTLTARLLLESRLTILHIEGAAKRAALARALAPGPIEDMPIRLFLRDARPLDIFWTPQGA